MLTQKEQMILALFLEQPQSYLSSQKIARKLGISDRTARKYIQSLGEFISSKGAQLVAKSGCGYCLHYSDESAFTLYYQDLVENRSFVESPSFLCESSDRIRYILHRLLLEEERPTVTDLAAELFLSKSSISQILGEIREQFLPYGLELNVGRKGIGIEGEESAIRHFIKDYFFSESFQYPVFTLLREELAEDITFSDLIVLVVDECRASHLRLPDYILHNLIIHLALMVVRTRLGKPIQTLHSSRFEQSSQLYDVSERLLLRLSEKTGLIFTERETLYLSFHLEAGSTVLPVGQEQTLRRSLLSCVRRLGEELGFPLDQDRHLLDSLLAHFEPFVHRLQQGMQLVNPLKEDLLSQYPTIVETVSRHFSEMRELTPYTVTQDEYAYIALHILASMEKGKAARPCRVLVVCSTGYGSARMLENRLRNTFGVEMDIVEVIGYLEVGNRDLKGIDLILSTVELTGFVFLVPTVTVSVLLTENDKEKIRSYMMGCSQKEVFPPSPTRFLPDYWQEIFAGLPVLYLTEKTDKERVVSALIERLLPEEDSESRENFHKQGSCVSN